MSSSGGERGAAVADEGTTTTISEDEKAVYDRQIRLWGFDAQNRLRNSTVLIAGLSGCGSEVAKNLMLAGLKSLTLLDDKAVTADDYCSQFLLRPCSEGKNRAEATRQRCQMLNPNVDLRIDTGNVAEQDEKYFADFDLVILVDQKYSVANQISKICRDAKKPFIAGGVFGWIGYAFFDFTECTFLVRIPKITTGGELDDDSIETAGPSPAKKPKINVDLENGNAANESKKLAENFILDDEDEEMKMTFSYSLWEDVWNVDWSHKRLFRKSKRLLPRSYFPVRVMLRVQDSDDATVNQEEFMELWRKELEECNHILDDEYFDAKYFPLFNGPQLNPACAIVGAHIAQEAIKVLSQKDDPLRNVFLYSAIDTSGVVCLLPPKAYFADEQYTLSLDGVFHGSREGPHAMSLRFEWFGLNSREFLILHPFDVYL